MTKRLLSKKWLSVLALAFCTYGTVQAQTTVQIGFGTNATANTIYSPVYRFSATSATTTAQSNMVFTATELNNAGIFSGDYITEVAFNKLNVHNFITPANYTLRMANSSATPPLPGTIATNWAGILLSHTIVYTDPLFNIPNVAGWATITLSSPFQYTGGSLEIAADQLMTAGGTGATGNFLWEYTPGFEGYIIGAATGNSNLSTYKFRPNIKITYSSVLGVDVLRFSARSSGRDIVTSWDVANEKDMSGYEVERATDGQHFERIGIVAAGTSSGSSSYSFTDAEIAAVSGATTLFYRLKCRETSGSFKYSNTTQVNLKGDNSFAIEAFPSLVTDVLTLRLKGRPANNAMVNVTNGSGTLIRKLNMTGSEGKIDLSSCTAGVYFVTYTDDSYTRTMKVTKR